MNRQTRREFLRRTALAGGAVALAPFGAHAAEAPVDMAIARWKGAAASEAPAIQAMAVKLTEQAMAAVGGMGRFVKKGDVVFVKPNIAWNRTPEYAANTNPDVVATLVRLCLEAGAKEVKVGDHTCNDAAQTYPNSGIEKAAKDAGATIVNVDKKRFKQVEINGKRLKTCPVYPEIVESDLVISAPICKHHNATTVSLCMKNFMGVIDKRGIFHQDLPSCISDLTAYLKPRLCVLDAVRVLTANGPTGGSLDYVERRDTVAVGTDIVAMDALGAGLLGYEPEKIGTIAAGHAAGLGQIDYRKVPNKEIAVS